MTYYKILLFMKRRAGMSVADFRAYYETQHVPLCAKYGGASVRYMRRYLEPQPHAESGTCDELPYDVITELWFDNEAAWKGTVRYLSQSVMPAEVVADELNLFDRATMRMATVVECEGVGV
ncbi:MAG: hypothetical protein RLY97_32 [Pseudomonadota bacterium]|jgi:uncharacterized protein (TIGR02118 family)